MILKYKAWEPGFEEESWDEHIYTGSTLISELYTDYCAYVKADERINESFEEWVGKPLSDIDPNKLYRTDSQLSNWEEVKESKVE